MSAPVIGFSGLTHLGLVSSVAVAARDFRVVGFDPDVMRVREIDAGRLPVVEPGLDDLFRSTRTRMTFTSRAGDLSACDLVYISADVPTDDRGQSDLSGINALIEQVIANLSQDALLVVLCQVTPGFTRHLKLAPDRIYYQVETLVFGRAVERATKPERFIVGCADPAKPLPPSFVGLLSAFGCPILSMRYESAELAKIAINCCLVASVSVANTLAELSECIGADWNEIVPALKLDVRIGQGAYLAPGLGLAGGNLERDLATVERLSEETGSDASVIRAFVANSAHRRDWALRALHKELLDRAPAATIGILGLAYKENTHSVKNSPSLALIANLGPWPLQVFDPVVSASAVPHPRVTAAKNPIEAARGVDALVIMTPWPEFRTLSCVDLAGAMRGRLVLDPYKVLKPAAAKSAGLDHRTLGVS